MEQKKETKRKEYHNYGEFNRHSTEKVKRGLRNLILKNVWTSDGKILFKDGSGNTSLFYD